MKKLIAVMIVAIMAVSVVALTGMKSSSELEIDAECAYLVDYDSGLVLVDKGSDIKRQVASMVKVMTLLLTFEAVDRGELNYDDMVVISHESAKQIGSEMFLDEGTSYSVNDIIKGVVTMSANDGSIALAEKISGSEQAFVECMNNRAVELGMTNTLYANPTGLPSEGEQFSTARDVTTAMRELTCHSKYYDYSGIWLEDYTHPSGRVTQLANTNKLIRHYKGCDSGKTGYTDSAKFCLSASASREGMRVVGTVMGANESKARFKSMTNMFNYAFGTFKRELFLTKDTPLSMEIKVSGGKVDVITPIISRDLAVLTPKNGTKYELKYNLPESVKAPIQKGQELGEVSIVDGEKVLMTVKILADESVKKASIWDNIGKIV